ncbi:hypothetical protein [Planctomyces sp. SH-PL62]|uniref:hypothetical protein n=1 Tax=Planctomyces sp. SH-PL62 TaxID=1636152 RepID=UPI00078CF9BA|nr:hypothetical protein [Planctomyces sp. SH-PL62]AMV40985.1 hypothetical protein VT85_26355 [Planctomyces sp. SH-PL62]
MVLRLTRAFVDLLRKQPLTYGERKAVEIEDEWFDALAESDSDGVFGILDPIPEQEPSFKFPLRKVKEPRHDQISRPEGRRA